MPDDRLIHILGRLANVRSADVPAATTRLCAVCAEVTEMSGAGIMLMTGDRNQGSVCTSNEVSSILEELQYTLGEGPCVDAYLEQRPVAEPDLADPVVVRWTAFAPPAVEAGARAIFGFPVGVGDVGLGALNLYRSRPGGLTPRQHDDALVLAELAGRAIVGMQAGAEPDALGADLEVGTNFRFVVHQAAGMVAVQLGIPVDEAFVRLRAYAFSHGCPVDVVAEDVLDRRLHFDPRDETPR
jgi:hypothetical protein